ncbi:RNA polymerase-binding transcription factor DksA [Zhongshania aliphaticivorans]|uniref:RNA polymerase-binding transcription factor DksA n=1 Tax=Zhongshania aliphaticivorans TaxID=1470434 RepID=A0A5S9N6J6_9GAMM|nr:TraR/DksA C4-type zinc finger protein [Zhongshania aliphaticivorans]CAA0080751.1 RNA polymerase-binding transcription factor DksA [Zhongshania aliphaticivorans]CAA0085527.1 RNA polymerase-binding transcription factor DksA [Zhongshania aliphaticivorans]
MALPKDIPATPYMNEQQLAFFSSHLLTLKSETLACIYRAQKSLSDRPELNDEADLAQYEEESRMALRIVDRETKLLPKIDAALERIRIGDYGYCLSSGEPIGTARLLIRPTAEYCAEVKKQMEEKEKHYGRRR